MKLRKFAALMVRFALFAQRFRQSHAGLVFEIAGDVGMVARWHDSDNPFDLRFLGPSWLVQNFVAGFVELLCYLGLRQKPDLPIGGHRTCKASMLGRPYDGFLGLRRKGAMMRDNRSS